MTDTSIDSSGFNLSGLDRPFTQASRRWWHPVARSVDVAPGSSLAVQLLGTELVVFRSPAGDVAVLDDLCVHRGTRLSAGSVTDAGCIQCPYHGWEYDGAGRCTLIPQAPDLPIPSRAVTGAYRSAEIAGLVWTCLVDETEQMAPAPSFPDASQEGWHSYAGVPMEWRCQATRQVENFLDIAHFSFLHADVFGNADAPEMDHYVVSVSPDDRTITTHYDYPASLAMPGVDERVPLPMGFDYEVTLPFTVRLVTSMPAMAYSLWSAASPLTASTTRLFWVMTAPEGSVGSDDVIEQAERAIFEPDRAIVEGQRPDRVPLDLGAELHLPFDRLAVAYRRTLAKFGFPVTHPLD